MKHVRSALIGTLVLAFLLTGSQPGVSDVPPELSHAGRAHVRAPAHETGAVLVRFARGTARASVVAASGGLSRAALGVEGWERIELAPGDSVAAATARFARAPGVIAAQPNYSYNVMASIPDDTKFGKLWGLHNTGQLVYDTVGDSDADIDAPEAWDLTTGSTDVVVGVVDTGVSYDHPDLEPNMWSNPGELGANGIDDDGNGFVDDTMGWDFYSGDADPMDLHTGKHGTHVAGTIGARGFDGYGVTGVSPTVSIMALRVLGSNGSGSSAGIAQAFDYAGENGAHVVNASLGGSGFDQMMSDAIAEHPNTLYVVAAGNETSNNEEVYTSPCNFSHANLVCVAATTQSDGLAGFSNYGTTAVDLGAPGTNIGSTYGPASAAYSGTWGLADSHAGYANNSDTWIQKATALNLTSQSNCEFTYRLRSDVRSGDTFRAERSIDGGATWISLESIPLSTDGSFFLRALSLLADNQPSVLVRFHFVTNGSGTDDGVFVDDVAVKCGGTVWSDGFESGLDQWVTGGTGAGWERAKVAGQWVYMDGTSMATPHVAGAAALMWAENPTASVAHVRDVLFGSVDYLSSLSGKTVTGGRLNARRAVVFVSDVAAPNSWGMNGLATYQRATSFGVGWYATDFGSAGSRKAYSVRYKRATYSGGFGSYQPWKTWTSSASTSFAGMTGATYCFGVRARDGALNATGYSGNKCSAIPLNDRSIAASLSWQRKSASDRYLGTYTYGTAAGAKMTLKNVRYKRLALLVTKCPGCGTVDVYRGSTKIGRYSLNATSKKTKQFISLPTLSARSGATTITIKIVSSGKPVAIEGLGIQAV